MGFTKTGVRLLWKPATYFLGKGCNVLILFFILQSTNEVLLLALFQRVLVWFFFLLSYLCLRLDSMQKVSCVHGYLQVTRLLNLVNLLFKALRATSCSFGFGFISSRFVCRFQEDCNLCKYLIRILLFRD